MIFHLTLGQKIIEPTSKLFQLINIVQVTKLQITKRKILSRICCVCLFIVTTNCDSGKKSDRPKQVGHEADQPVEDPIEKIPLADPEEGKSELGGGTPMIPSKSPVPEPSSIL